VFATAFFALCLATTQLQAYPIQTSIVIHRDKFSDPTHSFFQR